MSCLQRKPVDYVEELVDHEDDVIGTIYWKDDRFYFDPSQDFTFDRAYLRDILLAMDAATEDKL
jgi:hypothetical protein